MDNRIRPIASTSLRSRRPTRGRQRTGGARHLHQAARLYRGHHGQVWFRLGGGRLRRALYGDFVAKAVREATPVNLLTVPSRVAVAV
jgi:hypothetical protein